MKKLTKALVAASIVGAAVLGGPIAANAETYTPGAGSVTTVVNNLTVTFNIVAGTFEPGSAVTADVTGPGTVTVGAFTADAADVSVGNAANDGSLSATLTFSEAGTYTVVFTDAADNASDPITVTVGAVSGTTTAATGSLASTGSYISLATIWGAAGVIALGAGFVTVRTVVRRQGAKA
ncbi:hypothetical protein [Gryllotalpicola ginsengisoli]|uniref:hypothetical protein n=1 Tax=Gryllotalpicola ginsengisoli TaxID=444608 RepID=UPI0003B3720B|nr:hypothetical protein [Gryllotalpicola ginsengisoli]